MMPQLVGIAGHARHGKDTAAAVLMHKAGYTRIGFADAVREVVLAINPLLYGGVRLAALVSRSGWDEAKQVPEVRQGAVMIMRAALLVAAYVTYLVILFWTALLSPFSPWTRTAILIPLAAGVTAAALILAAHRRSR